MKKYELYTIEKKAVPQDVIDKKNKEKSWRYGYDEDHDVVVISKDGTIGDIYNINSVKIALPSTPSEVDDRGNKWLPSEYPKELNRIRSIFDWNAKPKEFKSKWVNYIENEFDRREYGHNCY